MGLLKYLVDSVYRKLFGVRAFCRHGSLTLNYGKHEVFVPVVIHDEATTPKRVWFSLDGHGCPVCLGSVNSIGCETVEGGFALYADVQTESLTITWFACL